MRISDWSSDVCSSDLTLGTFAQKITVPPRPHGALAAHRARPSPLSSPLFEMQAGLEALEQRAGADIARARKDAPLMAGSHPCAVPDCITPAKIGQLMCRGHWFMVSQKTRRAVDRKSTRLNSSH